MEDEFLGEPLIFIISQPRAGSTLLQRILGGHPDILTVAEPWLMLHPVYALKHDGFAAEYNARWAREAVADFLTELPGGEENYFSGLRAFACVVYGQALNSAGRKRFLDKTPRYYYIIPELAHAFPRAKFIFLLRNPVAVLASILKTWIGQHWPTLEMYSADLILAPRLILEGIDLLGAAANVLHYEALISHPETTIADLCQRLGLDFRQEMLEYARQPAFKGNKGDQTGILRFDRPTAQEADKWQELLSDNQGKHFALALLEALGETVVERLGYNYADLLRLVNDYPSRKMWPVFPWPLAVQPATTWTRRERVLAATVLRLQHGLRR